MIYLDNHSTTPMDPRVLEAMIPFLTTQFGNAASTHHAYGREAEKAVEKSRAQVAALIGADPDEIIFTGSATESNNLALKGTAEVFQEKGRHFITQVTEHKSVLEALKEIEKKAFQGTWLKVDQTGRIEIEDLKKAAGPGTILISIMFANNEIGTIQPIEAIGKFAKERGIFFHVDAAQAAGKIPIDVEKLGLDLLSFSAHKMYGPKGIAALYLRKKNPRVRIHPLFHGGGQEKNLRSGTLNVPGIVGFGKACALAQAEMEKDAQRIRMLKDRLFQQLEKGLGGVFLNGGLEHRLNHNLNISFAGVDTQSLLEGLTEKIAVSTGSACTTEIPEPSYVLKALGIPEERIHTSIRFGLGKFTTEGEIDETIRHVSTVVRRLRKASPFTAIDKIEH